MQQELFTNTDIKVSDKQDAARILINKIRAVRRSLQTAEAKDFEPMINRLIREIKSVAGLSETQQEELVLLSIKQGGYVLEDIALDTKFSKRLVAEILNRLKAKDKIQIFKRYSNADKSEGRGYIVRLKN